MLSIVLNYLATSLKIMFLQNSFPPLISNMKIQKDLILYPHLYPSLSKNSPQGVCVEWACEQLGNTCTLTSLILREKHVSSEPLALR